MVCVNTGNEFCKPPAWYRLGTEVAAAQPQRERGLQEMGYVPAVVTTDLGSSCSCLIIGLACLVMFVICLQVIKRKFQQVCSKCGGRFLCQGLRSMEQLLVKVGAIEQRMVVLEDFLHSICPVKRQAGSKPEVGTSGKVCDQLITAQLDKPVLDEDQSEC